MRLRASGLVAIGVLWVLLTFGVIASFVMLDLWIQWMAGTPGLALGSVSAGMASSS